ncbi:helical backbone metal receptor [Limnohabitans sp.]|uniref:ABC transporter substrate-binding protein n=1 Tax=Limnohabitans sp. TaxID=1907725 RepID=UPI00286F8DB8|nr:helical backbone metal receptor [Limnohabitans sp.]
MLERFTAIRRIAWLVLLGFCTLSQAEVLRDDRQVDVTIIKTPQRIVSLLPSLTETVCALGQCQKLVGVDRYSNWPETIAKLPRMGGGIDPNIESVVAAKPDLVLMATSARGAERFAALGLTVLALEPRSHADVQRVMRIVAQALDVPLAESDRVWRHIDAAVNAAAQSIPAQAKGQRVYFEVSAAPYGASESSFIGETLQRLGARNILPASLGPFPKINPEFVVRAQPDIIMVGDSNFADMASRPGWQNMHAMRTQRVCHFKSEESDVLVRAGPRMAEAARLMAKCLTDKANDKPKGQP